MRILRSQSQRLLVLLAVALVAFQAPNAGQVIGQQLNLRILVIAADGKEADLSAIQKTLDYIGTPYDLYEASKTPGGLTPGRLSSGLVGFYQGIILTTGDLGYNNNGAWMSALTSTEWDTLRQYERDFGVRRLAWFAFPTPEYGFSGGVLASSGATTATLTIAGQAVFPYVTASGGVPIRQAYTYYALPSSDGQSQPLLTGAPGGEPDPDYALALLRTHTDGRVTLALTFDSNQYLVHNLTLGYGLVNWVTKGLFLGQRRTYLTTQIDDLFIDNDIWNHTTPCGTPVDNTGFIYRLKGLGSERSYCLAECASDQPSAGGICL